MIGGGSRDGGASGDVAAPRSYRVRHHTAYSYDEQVTVSYGSAHLTPLDADGQRTRDSRIEVDPAPHLLTDRRDYFGNRCTYFEVLTPHTRLDVTATSVVEVSRQPVDLAGLDALTCADARAVAAGADRRAVLTDFVLPSPQAAPGPAVREYAAGAGVLDPTRPLGAALADLLHRIHADFAYVSGATSVTTALEEVLLRRQGVCQDFAHLAVGCLRAAGLAARYVSGYLETEPPPGQPRLQGVDASHAWFSVLVPGLGWVDLDPTNDQPVDDRYIAVAFGRDYTDVAPLKGVIFTDSARSTLSVGVDVVRLPG